MDARGMCLHGNAPSFWSHSRRRVHGSGLPQSLDHPDDGFHNCADISGVDSHVADQTAKAHGKRV